MAAVAVQARVARAAGAAGT